MGNSPKKDDKINYDDWQILQTGLQSTILINNKQNIQGQLYSIFFKPSFNIKQEMEIYYQRFNSPNCVVGVYGIQVQSKDKQQIEKSTIKVLTERIIAKFTYVLQLTLQEALYVLLQCLKGFQIIYQAFGYFQISQRLIGLNVKGEVKVWCNQNYGVNTPLFVESCSIQDNDVSKRRQYLNIFGKSVKNQNKMIRKILQIIEKKCKKQCLQDFRKITQCSQFGGFDVFLNKINQQCVNLVIANCVRLKMMKSMRAPASERTSNKAPMKPFKSLRRNDYRQQKEIIKTTKHISKQQIKIQQQNNEEEKSQQLHTFQPVNKQISFQNMKMNSHLLQRFPIPLLNFQNSPQNPNINQENTNHIKCDEEIQFKQHQSAQLPNNHQPAPNFKFKNYKITQLHRKSNDITQFRNKSRKFTQIQHNTKHSSFNNSKQSSYNNSKQSSPLKMINRMKQQSIRIGNSKFDSLTKYEMGIISRKSSKAKRSISSDLLNLKFALNNYTPN